MTGVQTCALPISKVDVDANGVVTKVSMIPTIWDGDAKKYVELKDLRAFRQITSEVTFSITKDGAEQRGTLKCGSEGNVCEATTLMPEGGDHGGGDKPEPKIADAGLKLSEDGSQYLTISYKIGDVTIRTEFRPDMSGNQQGGGTGTGTDTGSGMGTGG